MNILQILLHYIFRVEYVVLVLIDKEAILCRAYELGGCIYANPYLPYTRTKLLPGGKCDGVSYVLEWRPVTKKTFVLFGEASS